MMSMWRSAVSIILLGFSQFAYCQDAVDSCNGSVGASDGKKEEKYLGIKFESNCPKARAVGTRMYFSVAEARNGSGIAVHGATARDAAAALDIIQNAIGDNYVRGSLRTINWECPATETWAALIVAFPNTDNFTYRQSGFAYGCGFSDPKIALRRAYEYCRSKGICNVRSPGWVDFWLIQNNGSSERLSRHSAAKRCVLKDGRFDNEIPCPFGDAIN
jgi:hypothetical protein